MKVLLDNVTHSYAGSGVPQLSILEEFTLAIGDSERVSIVGPSGAGKTTLLRIIAGITTPRIGQVTLANEPPNNATARGKIGFVFQDPLLLPWRNILENVCLPLELLDRPKDRTELAQEWLRTVGLSDFQYSFPNELSGGMRSRASIARSVVTSPSLLLMDEPFNGLDEITAQSVMEEVAGMVTTLKASSVLVSHNIQQAVFLADRVLVLSERPTRILGEISVPFSWPRARGILSEDTFNDAAQGVRELIFQTASSFEAKRT